MSEWKEVEFARMLEGESISYGIVQPGAHTEVNSVPVIRVNNIKNGYIKTDDVLKVKRSIEDKYRRTRLNGGELLITIVGSVGECAIVPNNLKGWNVARAVSVARIKSDYDIRFIKYSFKTDDVIFQMYGNTNDTVQPTLNLSSLKSLKFNVPELIEQTAIASILGSLDDKIDLLHRQNQTLEKMAETLFRQWFVEEAKEEWEVVQLSEIAEVKNGRSTKSSEFLEYAEGRLEVVKMGHIEKNGGLKAAPKKDYLAFNESLKSWILEEGDIIMAMTDMKDNVVILGVSAMIDKSNYYILNQRVARIYLKDSSRLINRYLLYIQLLNKEFISTLQSKANSGVQVNLSTESIKQSEILVPPIEEQNKKGPIINDLYKRMEFNRTQIGTLTSMRDNLLPKLMSGEVRVECQEL